MENSYSSLLKKRTLFWWMGLFAGLFLLPFTAQAQQADRPFSIELNAGGGLIGSSNTNTAFQPELGLSYMPGRWGVGLNATLYSFDSDFSADQYRTGYEQYTLAEQNSDQWSAISINAGPRFTQSLSRFVSFNVGLDLAMNYQKAPSQSVRFNDPSGELESSGMDTDIVLAQMDGDGDAGWNTAIRPQLQLEFRPGFSNRFSFNVKTGIQHHLSDREITYTERDLSRVMQVDSPFEMHHQFENAPIVQRTETAPKTNFFANVGIKISFGGSSSRGLHPEGVIHRDIATRASSDAQDYNSSRSNKPFSEAALDDVVIIKDEGLNTVASFIDEIIEVLDRCEDEVCTQVRLNADGRVDKHRQVKQGQISQDQGIEDIQSIVMEDVVSLQKCETDVCREVLTKEVQLLEHMNVLMSLVQSGRAATARDYNSSRSNKPSSRADDIGGGGGDAGQQAVLITQDEEGKVYAWGGAPEAIMQDENGKLYSWGSNQRVSDGGDEGKVYSWGVASSAGLQVGDGEVYCWGDNSKVSLQDGSGEVFCWGDNSRTSVGSCEGGNCPQPDQTLYLAKELGLASVGYDIEKIKQVLDRCDEGVCGQVRQNADERHHGVTRAQENPSEFDTQIEEILNIVKEDVESLGRCETDVCREALAMEEKLLVKMNRLSDLAQVAPAQDYNSSRSNKPSSIADGVGDEDLDSDGDGIDDAVETAQDYNSSRSNKPRTEDGRGGDNRIVRDASRLARLANPSGQIISGGAVLMSTNNPLHEGETAEGENPLYEGQASNGDSDDTNNNGDRVFVQRFNLQPSSYCVDLATADSQPGMRADAQSHNSSRSNRTEGVANSDIDTGDTGDQASDSTTVSAMDAQSHNSSRSNRTEGVANTDLDVDDNSDTDSESDATAIPPSIAGLEVTAPKNLKPDTDQDGFPEMLKSASFSISKRSARTGRSQNPLYESETNSQTNPMYESEGAQSSGGGDSELDALHFELAIVPNQTLKTFFETGDKPTASQSDPLTDSTVDDLDDTFVSATYSFSVESTEIAKSSDDDPCGPGVWARITGGNENCSPESSNQENPLAQESGWNETPVLETAPPSDVYQWTYKLRALTADADLPGDGTLTVLFTGGTWHFDVQIDPVDLDDDGDGIIELLQNSSFSISKRSARM